MAVGAPVCLYGSLLFIEHSWGNSELLVTIDRWILIVEGHGGRRYFDPNLFKEDWCFLTVSAFVCLRLLAQVRYTDRTIPLLCLCLTAAGPLYLRVNAADE